MRMRLPWGLRALAAAVSRSFALSLNALPGPVRVPMALGYMLARAADTVADAEGAFSDGQRLEALDALGRAAAGLGWPEPRVSGKEMERVAGNFANGLPPGGERALLERLPELWRLAEGLPLEWRCELGGVLGRIFTGQREDVVFFPRGGGGVGARALPDAAALERYTYLVAGSVGGVWTRLCVSALPGYARASVRRLVDEGVRFGKGLQLVNVLRDRGEDLRRGRCYIPGAESAGGGPPDGRGLAAASEAWFGRARELLAAGSRYAAGIRGGRARFAVLLPMELGLRTLDLVEAAGEEALRRRVKVSRREVRRLALRALWRALRPGGCRGGWEIA